MATLQALYNATVTLLTWSRLPMDSAPVVGIFIPQSDLMFTCDYSNNPVETSAQKRTIQPRVAVTEV